MKRTWLKQYRKEADLSNSNSRKHTDFHMIENEKNLKELVIWCPENFCISLQANVSYKWGFDKKKLSLTSSIGARRGVSEFKNFSAWLAKVETFCERRYNKEKNWFSRIFYVCWEENILWHMKKKVTTNSKNNSIFVSNKFLNLQTHSLEFPICL